MGLGGLQKTFEGFLFEFLFSIVRDPTDARMNSEVVHDVARDGHNLIDPT